MSQGIFSFS